MHDKTLFILREFAVQKLQYKVERVQIQTVQIFYLFLFNIYL